VTWDDASEYPEMKLRPPSL